MPLGSSSAAPVIKPGPSTCSSFRLAGAVVLSSATSPMDIRAFRHRPQARCQYHRVLYLRLGLPSLLYRGTLVASDQSSCALLFDRRTAIGNHLLLPVLGP